MIGFIQTTVVVFMLWEIWKLLHADDVVNATLDMKRWGREMREANGEIERVRLPDSIGTFALIFVVELFYWGFTIGWIFTTDFKWLAILILGFSLFRGALDLLILTRNIPAKIWYGRFDALMTASAMLFFFLQSLNLTNG
tara:strand:+ start:3755 stop:4174 length:420 start_codon:yes stop_codon:yes gene_type:complete